MQVNRSRIIYDFKMLWPYLVDGLPNPTHLAIPDKTYWLPCIDEVANLLRGTFFEKYKYVLEGWDCDESAKVFSAFVAQERYVRMKKQGVKQWDAWALGVAWGSKFFGQDSGHALDIVDTRYGVYIIEPQNDRYWTASATDDHPHFIMF